MTTPESEERAVGTSPISPPEHEGLSIHKRPSSGRGEYELVGRQGDVVASDLADLTFDLETPFGIKSSNVYVGSQGGKRRFRRLDEAGPDHIQRQMAAMLLLPESTREEGAVSRALPVLLNKRYILDIDVHLMSKSAREAVLRPDILVARSADIANESAKARIPVAARGAMLRELYSAADALPPDIKMLVRRHETLVTTGPTIEREVATVTGEIMSALERFDAYYLPGTDPLPTLRLLADLTNIEPDVPEPPETPALVPEVRLRSEHIFRLRKMRGASASAFRDKVQKAYDFRCVFCGLRAPTISGRISTGVDAAHILPWGNYDLDVIPNGLMLCKQHHWAFDNRVLRVDHSHSHYHVSLVESAREALGSDAQTIRVLEEACGRIPDDRLPALKLRPSPTFIDEFNALSV